MSQQSFDDARCSSSLQQSAEVTYVEELMAEHPSANIAFMGRPMSFKAADESMVVEDDASTPLQECQDETSFQQESKAGAELPATILMAKNVFPLKAEGDIVTGSYLLCIYYTHTYIYIYIYIYIYYMYVRLRHSSELYIQVKHMHHHKTCDHYQKYYTM